MGQDNTDQTPQGTRRLRAVFTRSLEYQRSRAGHHPKAHLMRVNEVCTEALVTRQLRVPSLPECQGQGTQLVHTSVHTNKMCTEALVRRQ